MFQIDTHFDMDISTLSDQMKTFHKKYPGYSLIKSAFNRYEVAASQVKKTDQQVRYIITCIQDQKNPLKYLIFLLISFLSSLIAVADLVRLRVEVGFSPSFWAPID